MNKYVYVLPFLLAACGPSINQEETSGANEIEDNASVTWNKARDMLEIPRAKPKPEVHTQPRYCYAFYEDVACYIHPIAGQEARLTGWQDEHGHTGYVLEPAQKIKPLPELQPLKTVDVPTPPKVAEAKPQSNMKEIIFDPSELQPKNLVPPKTE